MTKTFILAASLLAAHPVAAQDLIAYGGAALEYEIAPDGAGSDNTTTLSSYIEIESAGFYAGFAGYVANDSASNEVDVYAGYRNSLESGLSYGLVYTRYVYPNDSASNYGEIALSLGQSIGDQTAVSLDAYYDHTNRLASAYVGAEFYATDQITLSANFGVYEQDGAPNADEWDLGLTFDLSDETAVDLRYYDGSDYTDGYIGIELTFDTTLFGG